MINFAENQFEEGLNVPGTSLPSLPSIRTSHPRFEDRFKSVIAKDGMAAKTIAAYIDLNPPRAGMVGDPAEYRWSSYGETIGGGTKGNGETAREETEGGSGK